MKTNWPLHWKDQFRLAREISRKKFENSHYFSGLITPLILNKINEFGTDSPIAKQFLISELEQDPAFTQAGLKDPIADQAFTVTPGLIHRYPNRALFLPTSVCPVHCRYCFRRNEISEQNDIFANKLEFIKKYLLEHKEIEEIIYTGGDPLSLDNPAILSSAETFHQVSTIKYLRLHTRFVSVIPERIDSDFLKLIVKLKNMFEQVILVLHINSHLEICDQVEQAIAYLKSSGIELKSQTVLLKNVNDTPDALIALFKTLAKLGVTPYYLHHADNVYGAKHFQISLESGREIYHQVRAKISGWMVPQYVIDLPSGGGKVPAYNPESFDFSNQLINRKGELETHFQS